MPIEPWFPLAVYYADIEDAAAKKETLIATILELETNSQKRRVDSESAWTGDVHGVGRIHENPNFTWIVEQIEAHSLQYLEALGIDLEKIDLYIQRSWPVVSRNKQEVAPHAHHNAHLSAVYYVSVPQDGTIESGAFKIYNDAQMNEIITGIGSEQTGAIKKWNPFNYEEGVYAPKEGRILIFPSKQRHSVDANKTGEMRISLSFDIVITSAETGDPGMHEFLSPPPSLWKKFAKSA
jgi:uncharacterized protein (TIGR02466 family)